VCILGSMSLAWKTAWTRPVAPSSMSAVPASMRATFRSFAGLSFATEMTESGTLTDATLQRLRDAYDDVICRKFILIIAWFKLLARFLNGCRAPHETGDKLCNRTSPLG
jgi:hypothetical protein